MRKLEDAEIFSHATVLMALASPLALRILEYLQSCTELPTIDEVTEHIQQSIKVIPTTTKRILHYLEKAEIVQLTGETFANPDPTHVLINPFMPDLAQAIVCEIWPDWEVTNPTANIVEKSA